MKHVGSTIDLAWANYFFDRGIKHIIVFGGAEVRKYQKMCRFHEDEISEIADQILAEHLGLTEVGEEWDI